MQRAVFVLLLSCLFWFRPASAIAALDAMSGAPVDKGAALFKKNLYVAKEAEFAYVRLKIGRQQKAQKDKTSEVSRTIKAIKKAAPGHKLIEVVVMTPGTEAERKSSGKFLSFLSSSQAAFSQSSLSLPSSATVQVNESLGGPEDIYDVSRHVVEFVDSLKLLGKAVVSFSDVSLAVQRSEEYAEKQQFNGCGLSKEVVDKVAHRKVSCSQCKQEISIGSPAPQANANSRSSISDFVNRAGQKDQGRGLFELESNRMLEVDLNGMV